MTSIFNQLLIKLQNKLMADISDSETTPGIRYVDQDLGQVDVYDTRPAVSFPCVLIDFSQTLYEQKQFKTQWAKMNINLRLVFDPYSASNSLAAESVREKALAYYEIENKIYLSLQEWNADGLLMLPMKRIASSTEKRDDKLRIRNIVFTAIFEDRSLQSK
jgi:hypothetical protein